MIDFPVLLVFLLLFTGATLVLARKVGQVGKFNLPLWVVPSVLSVLSAWAMQIITFYGILAISLLVVGTLSFKSAKTGITQFSLGFFLLIFSFLLATHKVPGFINPILFLETSFSASSTPFQQFANFDKAIVGLILLVFLCKRTNSYNEFLTTLRALLVPGIGLILGIIAIAIAIGYIKFDPKWPSQAPLFLLFNLYATCVPEEAFFRGLIQESLTKLFPQKKAWQYFAIVISGSLFGIVHYKGGIAFIVLSTLLGIGLAVIYQKTRRIEAPIIVHFFMNMVHFVFFSYPALKA